MKKILFNFIQISDEKFTPKSGSSMMLMFLNDIRQKNDCRMIIQMADNGTRTSKENWQDDYWNQCTFEDIDYKRYYNDPNTQIHPTKIFNDVCDWLLTNYKNILYFCEVSRSGCGFHFVFYFNVVRSLNNFMMCKAVSSFIIKQAFIECGYKEIIEAPNVYDDCSNSVHQLCFITKKMLRVNEDVNGDCNQIIEDNYYNIKSEYDRHKKNNSHKSFIHNDDWDIEFTRIETQETVNYIEHSKRFVLFNSLSGVFKNPDDVKEEWENCCLKIPECNGHTVSFYKREPYVNDWARKATGNEYVDTDMLKMFGYEIKFITKNNKNIFNKEYEYKTDEKVKCFSKKRIYF